MKIFRLLTALIVVLLVFSVGLVLAQDNLVIDVPDPFYAPPTQPLNDCSAADTELQVCDMIATQPEDIVGVWSIYFQAEPMFIRYNADGTWLIADTVEHTDAVSVEGFPYGSYSFDEGVFNSADLPEGVVPEACDMNRYVLHVIKVGDQPVALNRVVLEDCFAPRRTDWAYASLWVAE